MIQRFRINDQIVEAEQFLPPHQIPAGVKTGFFYSDPWDVGGKQKVYYHYVETKSGGEMSVFYGDWIVTDGNGHKTVKEYVFQREYVLVTEKQETI